jgi:hypothetical protein
MAVRTTLPLRGIRALTALVVASGIAVAQPAPPAPEPAKSPENPEIAPEIERPIVGVVDLRSDRDSAEIARVLEKALGDRPELRGIADSRVEASLTRPLDDEDSNAVAEARERLEQAREHLASFQLELAIVRAQEGRKRLIEVFPTAATTNLLADLTFTEGQAYFANQKKAPARDAFTLVHQLTPGRELDPNLYLPELVAAFTAAATPPTGSGTLEITAPGTLYVDGHQRGQGKQTLTVPPGKHIVVTVGADLLPSGKEVEVGAGQTETILLEKRTATLDIRALRTRKA